MAYPLLYFNSHINHGGRRRSTRPAPIRSIKSSVKPITIYGDAADNYSRNPHVSNLTISLSPISAGRSVLNKNSIGPRNPWAEKDGVAIDTLLPHQFDLSRLNGVKVAIALLAKNGTHGRHGLWIDVVYSKDKKCAILYFTHIFSLSFITFASIELCSNRSVRWIAPGSSTAKHTQSCTAKMYSVVDDPETSQFLRISHNSHKLNTYRYTTSLLRTHYNSLGLIIHPH